MPHSIHTTWQQKHNFPSSSKSSRSRNHNRNRNRDRISSPVGTYTNTLSGPLYHRETYSLTHGLPKALATRATQISAPASRTLLTSVSNLGQTLQQNARQFPGTVTTLSQTLGQRARELPSEIVNLPNRLEKERTDFIKQKSAEERGPKAGSGRCYRGIFSQRKTKWNERSWE